MPLMSGYITMSQGRNISLVTGPNKVSISASGPATISMWPLQVQSMGNSATVYSGSATATNGTNTTLSAIVVPMALPDALSFNNVVVPMSMSLVTTSVPGGTATYSQGVSLGLYTLNGANLSLLTSWSNILRISMDSSNNASRGRMSCSMLYGGSGSTASTTATSNWSAIAPVISGSKMIPLEWSSHNNSLSSGQYFAVIQMSHSTQGTAIGTLQSFGVNSSSYTLVPEAFKSTESAKAAWPLMGLVSINHTNSQSMVPSIATVNISGATGAGTGTASSSYVNQYPYFQLNTIWTR
jgi:hypothetical protein